MAKISTSTVASNLGETKVTVSKTFAGEGRKDIILSRRQEAQAFRVLRYYNWSKSFGMKTDFFNRMSDSAYGILQTLNDISAFTSSENLMRSIAARYGWVVAGRAFGKVQSRVLPQGGGPFGRFFRVKGGQFSRKVLGDFMNYFTTTEMTFENIRKTQRNIIKELNSADSIGPTWAGMALAEAITGAPDPYATQARQVMRNGRMGTVNKAAGYSDYEIGKTDSYLSKRTDVLQNLAKSGMSAPEMTYLIKAMEQGGDPDDIMRKYNNLSSDIMNTLQKHERFNKKTAKTVMGPSQQYEPVAKTGKYRPEGMQGDITGGNFITEEYQDTQLMNIHDESGKGAHTLFDDDVTYTQEEKVNAILAQALGIDLYEGHMQVFETFFTGSPKNYQIGPDKLKYGKTTKKTRFEKIYDSKGRSAGEMEVVTGGTLKDETGAYSDIDSQMDNHNYRVVRSSSNIKEHNYIASRPHIVKGLRLMDVKNMHSKNPKGGFLAYGIEFFQHKGIRDIQQIEYGGPATDKFRSLKNRSDRYVYPRSMFVHKAAQKAANKLGIEADLKFSKRKGDVMGTLRQRRTKAISAYKKDKNQATAKKGGFTLMVDARVRDIMKKDLIRARSPRVINGNQVKFDDITVSEGLIQSAEYNSLIKGANNIQLRDAAGNVFTHKLDPSDYPAEYKNALDKLRDDLKKNLIPISGDMPLSDEYYLSAAFAKSDARRRQTQFLSNELGTNEFGNRRQLDPTQLRRQNFRVRGGVWRPEDIYDQAVAEVGEEMFPIYLNELNIQQKEMEKRLDIEAKAKMAALRKEKLSGEAYRKRKIEIENEIDAMYESGYQVVQDRAWTKTIGSLNINSPQVQQKIADINKQIEGVIRGSGNRGKNLFPFSMPVMRNKYMNYYGALQRGSFDLADELFDELTNGGKIQLSAIENQLGFKYVRTGTNSAGRGIYKRTSLQPTEIVEAVPREDIVNPPDRIKDFRDLRRQEIKGNAGLNEVRGVGGNVSKSKTNMYGNPTQEEAFSNIAKIFPELLSGFSIGSLERSAGPQDQELMKAVRDIAMGDKNMVKIGGKRVDVGHGIKRAYRDAASYIKTHSKGERDTGGVIGTSEGLKSISSGKGRDMPKFKNAMTHLVEKSFQDDTSFQVVHVFLALETDQRVIDEIIDAFDPNSESYKAMTGQKTKRPQGSVSYRFGMKQRAIDIAYINSLRHRFDSLATTLGQDGRSMKQTLKDILLGF